ncbi:alpha-glucan family phosphorylase [Agriterribacter sp.]|uniref:alpha-glucan family phosphorylase n=1 Tax=Agriterribacter sp. TaxID=2821509 RepID=UPI002C32FB3B|nr:alpha-glucan family phosphorylase [Agriterribacter sp.]HRP54781.1 alpha-glucan family phosphorylase [Agriterribacter sp.]
MDFSKDFPYSVNPDFSTRVAYFCMEYAIHQSLKLYAGGLGFLAGSHMRSAYELKQNTIGIGILWKYGYYDQVRKADKTMDVLFEEKIYGFLKKTDVKFTIRVSGHDVFVTAYYLPPEVFQTVPVFFLSTDLPENDYLAKTICYRLYDSNPESKLAAAILLGQGGAKLLEKINWLPDIYHLNESHALPLAFYLFKKYKDMYQALRDGDDRKLTDLKKMNKRKLFEEVADQNGEIYDEHILTIVFAKRFGNYKRPGLLLQDADRFHQIAQNINRPVQIIWAGKPYPTDYEAIALFDRIVNISKTYFNCAVLIGYELKLSGLLKHGADIWLNVPRLTREASGTSGMTAAMNGAINVSTLDGWYPEFAKHRSNGYILTPVDADLPDYRQDEIDANNLYNLLEQDIIPMYYDNPGGWLSLIKHSMQDIIPEFDSKRMVTAYYEQLYCADHNMQEL